MKYYIFFFSLLILLLTGCDTDGDTEGYKVDEGYMQIQAQMVLQGNTDRKYTFTYMGQPANDNTYYNRADTVGEFIAMNGGVEELRTTLHVRPGMVIRLIQLPGQPVQFLNSIGSGEATAPQDRQHTKVRFLFDMNAVTAESLRVILRMNDLKGTPFDTLEFRKGELSPYSEDLSIDAQKESPYMFNLYDMANPAKPKPLWTKTKMNIDTTSGYKLMTYRVDYRRAMTFLLGEKWNEE